MGFRDEVRGWIEANAPEVLRGTAASPFQGYWGGRGAAFPSEAHEVWFERCLARGWTAPGWPEEYGGAGLSAEDTRIVQEEMWALRVPPPLVGLGLTMIGPVLLDFGTDAQKKAHVPPIVRGEIRWCQGFSEPDAGSDLASLRTRAVRDGDVFVVDGQKVWTSHADRSDWIFFLARTDPDVKKQRGLTFFVADMRSDGITTRPIELISGASPFCETFFEGVRVPVDQVIGDVDAGWSVAKALLGYERGMVGESIASGGSRAAPLVGLTVRDLALAYVGLRDERLDDPVLRDELARLEMEEAAMRLTVQRVRDAREAGVRDPGTASVLKLFGTAMNQRRWDLAVRLMGDKGLGWDGFEEVELAVARQWLRSRGNTIEGGTSEVQRTILATGVLDLPRGR